MNYTKKKYLSHVDCFFKKSEIFIQKKTIIK